MKLVTMLIPLAVFVAGCQADPQTDRDVFSLGDDFHEISAHADSKKATPDMDMLLRVHLPSKPTRSEIINYINIIFTLSRNQRTYLDSDPQVGMLTKVGRNNIDLILQASRPGVQWVKYGIEAVSQLAGDQDRNIILEKLKNNYELSRVVYAKGWCEQAESILTNMVAESSGYLPGEAIKCLASLKKPELYPVLINYMKGGWNSHTTYGIIKNLPGIELTQGLQAAWEGSRGNNYQIAYLTRDTLATGYMPAFHFLFDTIDDNYKVPITIYNAESLIKQFTNQRGDKTALKNWYEINREDIVFDEALKKYVVAKASARIKK
jgi:hypothetical protein